jgi:hypothetical protein
MPYCPECRYEYKSQVKICPNCGEKLIARLKKVKKAKDKIVIGKSEPKLRLLYTTKSMIYINFLKETLGENHIPCLIKCPTGVNLRIGGLVTDIKVYVQEKDFEKSLKIREQLVDSL